MANPPPLTQMKAQYESLFDAGWGKNCVVTRLSGVADTSGHITGTMKTIVSGERIWIQPNSGRGRIDQININEETTDFAYRKLAGTALLPKDRILPSGETYRYDVIYEHVFETHRMAELKKDLRVSSS